MGDSAPSIYSDYFRSVVRRDSVPEPNAIQQELLDHYEEIARSPDLYLEMDLEPGDIHLVSNHSVLHARTDYEDWPEPERRRHLLRLWLFAAPNTGRSPVILGLT